MTEETKINIEGTSNYNTVNQDPAERIKELVVPVKEAADSESTNTNDYKGREGLNLNSNCSDQQVPAPIPAADSTHFYSKLIKWTRPKLLYKAFIYLMIPTLVWIVTFLLVGKQQSLPPHGPFFTLILLVFGGIGLGLIMDVLKLPPLLGMLALGIIIRNVPFWADANLGTNVTAVISTPLKRIALVIILIRAGLGLDAQALSQLKGAVVRLGCCPSLCETITVGISAYFLLGFPWAWSFLLGLVLTAVSPAVIVPSLLSLKEQGLGVDKGIPTLVIASASIDNVLAISLFGVALGITFSQETHGTLTETIVQGPLGLILGLIFGIIWGFVLGIIFVTSDKESKIRSSLVIRTFLLLTGGIVCIFGSYYIKYPGAGALGCVISTFICSTIWRKKRLFTDGDSLSWAFGFLWLIFQPLLFGLIGCEIDLLTMESKTVGFGILCLCIGIMVRSMVSYAAVSGTSLNVNEKLFVAISWLPKGTVQAAIGSVALDTARKTNAGQISEEFGVQVLTIAVLSILLTAPIGAALINLLAPKLLTKTEKSPSNTT